MPPDRTGSPDVHLSRAEFERRFQERFADPRFDEGDAAAARARLTEVAHENYEDHRKAPRTRKAGAGYADPDYDLSVDWLDARARIEAAARTHADAASRSRVLVVNASPRSDRTCPSEPSKTLRIAHAARDVFTARGLDVDLLDLSALTAEYGRVIYPCKGCVSTAMPLCHWPCSCYPHHSLGQTGDWMNELYPRFVAAHGLFVASPVHWYQAPTVLKLVMDRLVCADGGNPDPTTTHGKKAAEAKALELAGWPYPRHLAGRAYAVVVHGDAAGAETLQQHLSAWLADLGLVSAGPAANLARYVGYYEPYATSHEALDRDDAFFAEVRAAADALADTIDDLRAGRRKPPDEARARVRPK